jgi:hypothetical protein
VVAVEAAVGLLTVVVLVLVVLVEGVPQQIIT